MINFSRSFNLKAIYALMIFVVLFLLSLPSDLVTGQEEVDDNLFAVYAEPDSDQSENVDLENAKRSKLVTINVDLLKATSLNPNEDALGSETIRLNMFDDIVLDAKLLELQQLENDGLAWVGEVVGQPFTQVTFVIRNDQVTGNIRIPSSLIEIRPVDGNLHVLKDIDFSAFTYDEGNDAPPAISGRQLFVDSDNEASTDDGSVIDVMVVYSEAARIAAGGTAAMESLIDLGFTETNTTYANSGVNFTINKVHTYETSFASTGNSLTDLNHLTSLNDGVLDDVHALRDTHNADMVSLWLQGGGCGIGWLWSRADTAFSIARRDCATGNLTFGHEIGHNMGARHDWYVDDTNEGATRNVTYNHGLTNPADGWRTVMAYNNRCSAVGAFCTRLTYMSNPAVFEGGDATGVAPGTSTNCTELNINNPACDAHNVQVLNSRALTVANFRQAPVVADDWFFNNNTGSYVSGSTTQIQSTGTGTDWSASFWRKDGSTIGNSERVSFEFKVDQKNSQTHLSIVKAGGDYERLAILDLGGALFAQVYRPNAAEPTIYYPLLYSTQFQADTWYKGSITVDDQYGFFIEVEERDNPTIKGTFRDSNGLFATGNQWSFFGLVYQNTVNLDSYLEETVTLSPPEPDDWYFNNQTGAYVAGSETQIQSTGTGTDWSASFWRKDGSTFGSSNKVSFDFKVDEKNSQTHLSIVKVGGDYERLAILDVGGALFVQIYRPNATEPAVYQPLLYASEFQADTWYSGSITVDDVYGTFVEVSELNNPAVSGTFRDTDGLLTTNSQWTFFGLVYQDSVNVDNYLEESVTLTPPDPDDWIFNNNSGSYVSGSATQIQVDGTGVDFNASFWRKDNATYGDGDQVSFDFKVNSTDTQSHLSIAKVGGDLERVAILDVGGTLYAQVYRPNATEPAIYGVLLSSAEFQADTWYTASISLADANGFLVSVTQRDNAAISGSYLVPSGVLTSGSQWSYLGFIYQDSVFIDNFQD